MDEPTCPYCGTPYSEPSAPDDCCHGAEAAALRREIKQLKAGLLSREDVEAIAQTVVAHSRPGMRVAIGDSTPKQYDRADHMAGAIRRAVYTAMGEIGLYEPEAEDACTG